MNHFSNHRFMFTLLCKIIYQEDETQNIISFKVILSHSLSDSPCDVSAWPVDPLTTNCQSSHVEVTDISPVQRCPADNPPLISIDRIAVIHVSRLFSDFFDTEVS